MSIPAELEKVVRRTEKSYYVRSAFDKRPAQGQPGWIASVRVHPSMQPKVIDKKAFGKALVLRLGTGEVRGILDRECKTGLMAAAGMVLTTLAYLVAGTLLTPALWLDPLGTFVKAVPGAALAAMVWLLLDER